MRIKRYIWFLAALLSITMASKAQSLPRKNIWEGTAQKAEVGLTPFLAEGDNRPAVIVCPGGSYFWHDYEDEGNYVGEWLQKNGISAFVLEYRTAKVPAYVFHSRLITRGNQYPDPQDDLQQAIAFVKDHAEEYRIDTTFVGAMGFSAGGHLVMSVAEMYKSPRMRPDFVVPVYPVVTLSEKVTHKRSRRGLLGEYRKHNKKWRNYLSLEKHVPEDCPPVLLVHCIDDPVVKYQNSVLLHEALTEKGVNHKFLLYKTGGHGFGQSDEKGSEECRQWKKEFLKWINSIYDSKQ